MYDIIKFLKPAYLFEYRPYTTDGTIKIMAIFFAMFLVAAVIIKIVQQVKKLEKYQDKMLEKLISFFTGLGVIGLLITWTRYERVLVFSSRYWLLVWLAAAIIWLYPIMKYWIKIMPEAKKRSEEKKAFQKYLPKKS